MCGAVSGKFLAMTEIWVCPELLHAMQRTHWATYCDDLETTVSRGLAAQRAESAWLAPDPSRFAPVGHRHYSAGFASYRATRVDTRIAAFSAPRTPLSPGCCPSDARTVIGSNPCGDSPASGSAWGVHWHNGHPIAGRRRGGGFARRSRCSTRRRRPNRRGEPGLSRRPRRQRVLRPCGPPPLIAGRTPRQTDFRSPTHAHANTMRSPSKDGESRPEDDQTLPTS
jgi:hypothetical protein